MLLRVDPFESLEDSVKLAYVSIWWLDEPVIPFTAANVAVVDGFLQPVDGDGVPIGTPLCLGTGSATFAKRYAVKPYLTERDLMPRKNRIRRESLEVSFTGQAASTSAGSGDLLYTLICGGDSSDGPQGGSEFQAHYQLVFAGIEVGRADGRATVISFYAAYSTEYSENYSPEEFTLIPFTFQAATLDNPPPGVGEHDWGVRFNVAYEIK